MLKRCLILAVFLMGLATGVYAQQDRDEPNISKKEEHTKDVPVIYLRAPVRSPRTGGLNLAPLSTPASQYVEIAVAENGGFTMGTLEGDPTNPNDNNKDLLFGHPKPWSSATTIRVDETDDWNYNGATIGTITTPPYNSGNSNITVWDIDGVKVTQTLTIVEGSSGRLDNLEIRYTINNNTVSSHDIGVRVMLDTMLGSNDGAPFKVPGIGDVTTEMEFTSDSMPQYWEAFDDLANPTVQSRGTLQGGSATVPDRFVAACWPLNETPWDFTVDPTRPITGDSAVGMCWYPVSIEPGRSRTFITYYGLSGLSGEENATFRMGSSSSATLTRSQDDELTPNPFSVTAYIQNIDTDTIANDVTATINLTNGLAFYTGEVAAKDLGNMSPNEQRQTSWQIWAIDQIPYGIRTYAVTLEAINADSLTVGDSVEIPPPSDDIYEENDNASMATVLTGDTYPDLTCFDDDWYTVYLNSGDSLSVTIYFTHAVGDLEMKLYDPNLARIDSSNTTSDDETVSAEGVITPGHYHIQVYGHHLGVMNNYSMRIAVDAGLVITDLLPENNARSGSNNVTFTWRTNLVSSSTVFLKAEDETTYSPYTGDDGLFHTVTADNLPRNKTCTYYIESTTSDGKVGASQPRSFYIDNGIMFSQRVYTHTVERDYNQQPTPPMQVINTDNAPHTLLCEIINPYEDLVVGFTGDGSMDAIIEMGPNSSQNVNLVVHAQDAQKPEGEYYEVLARITTDTNTAQPMTDEARLRITVHWPNIDFTLEEIETDTGTLSKRCRITNQGDALTDLRVTADENLTPFVIFEPVIEHAGLASGGSLEFKVIPSLKYLYGHPLAPRSGVLTASSGKEIRQIAVDFSPPAGKDFYPATLNDVCLVSRTKVDNCTNHSPLHANFQIPAEVEEDKITQACLTAVFGSSSGVYPHNVRIYANDTLIGELLNTVPSGLYTFDLPAQVLNIPTVGVAQNSIRLDSTMNRGSYLPLNEFIARISLSEVTFYCVATDQTEADRLAASNPYFRPGSDYATNIEQPQENQLLTIGTPVTIQTKSAGGESDLSVRASFSNGDSDISLTHQGSGVYTGRWTPTNLADGSCTITVNSEVCSCGGIEEVAVRLQEANGAPPPAENYAPILVFDLLEEYFPVDPFFAGDVNNNEDTDVYDIIDLFYLWDEDKGWFKPIYPEDFKNSAPDNCNVKKYFETYPTKSDRINNMKVFYHIYDEGSSWVYQYWLYYPFNIFFTKGSFEQEFLVNQHYGDWEKVFVWVDKESKKPTRVAGSAHNYFNINPYLDSPPTDRPYIFVEKGSHANVVDKDGVYNHINPKEDYSNWDVAGVWELVNTTPNLRMETYILEEIDYSFKDKFGVEVSFPDCTSLPHWGFDGEPPEHPWYQTEYGYPGWMILDSEALISVVGTASLGVTGTLGPAKDAIVVVKETGEIVGEEIYEGYTLTKETGEFALVNIKEGVYYTVEAFKEGYANFRQRKEIPGISQFAPSFDDSGNKINKASAPAASGREYLLGVDGEIYLVPDTEAFTISGTVTDGNGSSLPNATVNIYSQDGTWLYTTLADENGGYQQSLSESLEYTIAATFDSGTEVFETEIDSITGSHGDTIIAGMVIVLGPHEMALTPSDVWGKTGDTVTVSILLSGSSSDIKSFQFTFNYDISALTPVDVQLTPLTLNHFAFGANEPDTESGQLIVGWARSLADTNTGSVDGRIPAGSTGSIIDLIFEVTACDTCTEGETFPLSLSNLVDDIEGAYTSSGVFTFREGPTANAGVDISVCSGTCTTLNGSATGGTPPYSYFWSPTAVLSNPNDSTTTASPDTTTTYTLTVTDDNGYTDQDQVSVTVNECPATPKACILWVENCINRNILDPYLAVTDVVNIYGLADTDTAKVNVYYRAEGATVWTRINTTYLDTVSTGNFVVEWDTLNLPEDRSLLVAEPLDADGNGFGTELDELNTVEVLVDHTPPEVVSFDAPPVITNTTEKIIFEVDADATTPLDKDGKTVQAEMVTLQVFDEDNVGSGWVDLMTFDFTYLDTEDASTDTGLWRLTTDGNALITAMDTAGIDTTKCSYYLRALVRDYACNTNGLDQIDTENLPTSIVKVNIGVVDSEVLANAGSDDTICSGTCTTLNGSATGGTPPYSYFWSPTAGLSNSNIANPNACPDATTTYTLTVTDNNGRIDQDQVIIKVKVEVTCLTMPWIITPKDNSEIRGVVIISATTYEPHIQKIKFEYMNAADTSDPWYIIADEVAGDNSGTTEAHTWTTSWDTTGLEDGTFFVRATSTDIYINEYVGDSITVTIVNIVLPDNIAPVIVAIDPGNESEKAPGEVSKFVSAVLDDGPKGSGIDFSRSVIALLDPDMILVAGRQANDDANTLYWMLDEPLIAGGEYTILVKPVDKANNGSEAKPQEFKFRVKDTVAPSVIKWYPSPSPTVSPGFTDDIWVALIDEGGSGLDINSCQISLFKDTASIVGEISNDNASMLIFSPTSPLTESGTYTIKVVATDKEGNIALDESTFTILPGIEVTFQDKVYLILPATTKTIDPDTFVVEGAITIDTPVSVPEPPEGMDIIGSNISFIPSNLEFDKDVILKMHYTDDELSSKETTVSELKIYEYDGSSWKVADGGEVLYGNDKYLLLNIKAGSALANNYALLFTLPQPVNVSFKGEVYLSLSVGTKRTDISPATLIKSGMITLPDTPPVTPEPSEGMDIIGSIISFEANPPIETNLKFDKDVVLTMHYTDDELSSKETTASKLKTYKHNGSSWVVADGGGSLNEDNKELTLTIPANSALANKYALFFSKAVSSVTGKITQSDETTPIQAVLIEALKNEELKGSDTTDSSGNYAIGLPPDTYTLRFSANGYATRTKPNVVVNEGQEIVVHLSLYPPSTQVTVIRDLPACTPYGATVEVEIMVNVDEANTPNGLIVKEYVPSGWTVISSVPNHNGFNSSTGEIKWVFTGAGSGVVDRTIVYRMMMPADESSGNREFAGEISYNDPDGNLIMSDIGGEKAIKVGCIHESDINEDGKIDDSELLDYIDRWAKEEADDFDLLDAIDIWAAEEQKGLAKASSRSSALSDQVVGLRDLPLTYLANSTISVSLDVDVDKSNKPNGLIVKEYVPLGWTVISSVPDSNSFNSLTGEIKWVFINPDVADVVITYQVRIPEGESEAKTFNGQLLYNDPQGSPVTNTVCGDARIATAGKDLDNIRVYPNPFKPYDGNPETGEPYRNGFTNSGIIFDPLSQDATIKIFNLAGELVAELSGITGCAQWDAKNESGKEVASGVYIYLVTDKAGSKPATGKFVIIR